MKKLLYITAFPPNNKTGGQSFSLNAIKELSQSFLIDIIYFSYPEHECELYQGNNITSIKEFSIKQFDFLKKFWIHPVFTRRFNRQYLRKIQAVVSNYEVLYFDFTQVAFYSLFIQHPYKILRSHDVFVQKFSRKNKFLGKWVSITERKIVKSFTKVFVPSKKDVDLLRNGYGVNAFYTNEYLKQVIFQDFIEQRNQFIFYGYWKRPENTNGLIWFLEKVLPLIQSDSKFLIIGGGLSNEITKKILVYNQFEYLGFVNNPLDIIMQSSAVIVPLFQGAGIKVKVIDAFTAGTPVIGTDLAFEGLPNVQGLSYCTNNENDFAKFINDFKPFTYEEKRKKAKEFNTMYNKHHLLEQI